MLPRTGLYASYIRRQNTHNSDAAMRYSVVYDGWLGVLTAPDMTANPLDRYSKEFLAGWGTMDFNRHLANTAYLNLAADVRVAFFSEHGFPPSEFRRLAIGPVVRKEELEYFREIGLHETVVVTYWVLGMSPDGSRFQVENEIWSPKGERAAVVRSTGGWLDLRARKLIVPPPELFEVFQRAPKAPGFVELPLPRPK